MPANRPIIDLIKKVMRLDVVNIGKVVRWKYEFSLDIIDERQISLNH